MGMLSTPRNSILYSENAQERNTVNILIRYYGNVSAQSPGNPHGNSEKL